MWILVVIVLFLIFVIWCGKDNNLHKKQIIINSDYYRVVIKTISQTKANFLAIGRNGDVFFMKIDDDFIDHSCGINRYFERQYCIASLHPKDFGYKDFLSNQTSVLVQFLKKELEWNCWSTCTDTGHFSVLTTLDERKTVPLKSIY